MYGGDSLCARHTHEHAAVKRAELPVDPYKQGYMVDIMSSIVSAAKPFRTNTLGLKLLRGEIVIAGSEWGGKDERCAVEGVSIRSSATPRQHTHHTNNRMIEDKFLKLFETSFTY